MDPASSKLLLWLMSFTRDRESSSSVGGAQTDGALFNPTCSSTGSGKTSKHSPVLLLLSGPGGGALLTPSLKKNVTR